MMATRNRTLILSKLTLLASTLACRAATSPVEDIAEAWSFFIFSPKPGPDSIANEKVMLFYEFPELVQLREKILTNICEVFPY